MSESPKKGKSDDIKINMKQDYEVQYWSRKWGITPLQLEVAVKATGTNLVKELEKYLRDTGKIIDF